MIETDATRLHRLMNCNGSRLMPAAFPASADDPTKRDEGTAAHYMAKAIFDGLFQPEEMVDRRAPNGFYMDAAMSEHVRGYLQSLTPGEMEVDTSYAGATWQVNGRADHISYRDGTLDIDEFKYGYSIVEPDNNWTLLSHAIGTCLRRQITPIVINLNVYQPRPYHPEGKRRTWRISYSQLIEFYARINATLSNPSDMLQTGAWCNKCPSNANCPASRAANYNAIDATSPAFDDGISDERLSFEIDLHRSAATTIKARLDALEEMAQHRLRNGAVLGPYHLETQYGHRAFTKEFNKPETLRVLTGKDLTKPGTCTPAEAERRGVPREILDMITYRPKTGTKLIRMDANKRAQKLLQKEQ